LHFARQGATRKKEVQYCIEAKVTDPLDMATNTNKRTQIYENIF
jgi:hypothetical protein